MRLLRMLGVALGLIGCRSSDPLIQSVRFPVSETERGMRTSRVIATRHENTGLGLTFGFDFPKDINNADRAEVGDFFRSHNGSIVQGGGYPGATAYVVFKDVSTRAEADRKLREVLPPLSQLMADMAAGRAVHIDLPPPKYTWPDTEPPDKSDPYWKFNNNLNVNGVQYLKKEVSPDRWQWVVDEDSMRRMDEYENHRRDLWRALKTRVLTDAELKEVQSYGSRLNIEPMVAYRAEEKSRELQTAIQMQMLLQQRALAAAQPAKGDGT